jgi:hypothetical protein
MQYFNQIRTMPLLLPTSHSLRISVFLLIDLLVPLLALAALNPVFNGHNDLFLYLIGLLGGLILIALTYLYKGYDRFIQQSFSKKIQRIVSTWFGATLITFLAAFTLNPLTLHPSVLIFWALLTPALLIAGKLAALHLTRTACPAPTHVLIIGTPLAFTAHEQTQLQKSNIQTHTTPPEQLTHSIDQWPPHYLLLNLPDQPKSDLIEQLTHYDLKGLSTLSVSAFMERFLRKCYVPASGGVLPSYNDLQPFSPFQRLLKSAIDLSAALLLLGTLWPLMLYIALRIKHQSPGRVFYTQQRVGQKGRPFSVIKFRTMHENSHFDPYTHPTDPRVFPFGQFLRKTHLDELPQLWNVLKDAVISEAAIYRHVNAQRDERDPDAPDSETTPALSKTQVTQTLAALKAQGKLHKRSIETFDRHTRLNVTEAAVTTEPSRELERQMLNSAERMNQTPSPSWLGKLSPTLEKLALNSGYLKGGAMVAYKHAARQVDAKITLAALKGHQWTSQQRQAAIGILSHRGRLSQLQGYAGTAKTSSVLAAIRDISKREGYQVLAVAPSHAASQQLQKDIQADQALTTSGYLAKMRSNQWPTTLGQKVLVIHDEAGLASAKQMSELLKLADHHGHRLVNSGDRYQKAAIGAGSAFAQLSDHRVPTFELTTIFRQKDRSLKQAVRHSLPKDPNVQAAMARLQESASIREIKDAEQRFDTLARTYTDLSPDERARTLLLDPTRKGVEALNQRIRSHLQEKGELPANGWSLTSLHSVDIAKADLERGAVGSVFQVGHIVTLNGQALKKTDAALVIGSQWRIVGFERSSNRLKLEGADNTRQQATLSGSQLAKTHASVSDVRKTPVAIGEAVRFVASDPEKGILTNETARVTHIDRQNAQLTLSKADGQSLTLDGHKMQALDYDYARTTFSAQGQTAHSVVYHAQSTSTNLMNQRDFYVGLSRATTEVKIVTDSKRDLTDLIERSTGEKLTALEKPEATTLKQDDTQKDRLPGQEMASKVQTSEAPEALKTTEMASPPDQSRSHDHSGEASQEKPEDKSQDRSKELALER